MTEDAVVIASYARTPIGGFQGDLAGLKATQLGASAVRAAVERAGVEGEAIERMFMGCVVPAGLGQGPARQAALGADRKSVGYGKSVSVRVCPGGIGIIRK